jgi:hypothetical protein
MKTKSVLSFVLVMFFCFGFVANSFAQIGTSMDYSPAQDSLKLTQQGYQIYTMPGGMTYAYTKPTIFQPFKGFFVDGWDYTKRSFRKDNLLKITALVGWTAMMGITWDINGRSVNVDQKIIDGAHNFAHYIGLNTKSDAKNISSIDGVPLYIPNNFNTSMYYLGDGITDMIIDAGFLTYGLLKNDYRAMQTSAQILEGMMVVGAVTQIMKHVSGRQTPLRSTQAGGKWQWFPNQKKYANSVPSYDAFPSGHLCTSMMTFTVIAENYPEHKVLVWTIGGTLMTALTTAMLVNGEDRVTKKQGGVHWASDYPLAAAIGYGFGRLVVAKHRLLLKKTPDVMATHGYNFKNSFRENFRLQPVLNPYGMGLGLVSRF